LYTPVWLVVVVETLLVGRLPVTWTLAVAVPVGWTVVGWFCWLAGCCPVDWFALLIDCVCRVAERWFVGLLDRGTVV